jgi:hypothetical protein
MRITRKNLGNYLITLQLLYAKYEITFEEIEEMYSHKFIIDSNFRYFDIFTTTVDQNKRWFVDAVKLTMKVLKCNEYLANQAVSMLDLDYGLGSKKEDKNDPLKVNHEYIQQIL